MLQEMVIPIQVAYGIRQAGIGPQERDFVQELHAVRDFLLTRIMEAEKDWQTANTLKDSNRERLCSYYDGKLAAYSDSLLFIDTLFCQAGGQQ